MTTETRNEAAELMVEALTLSRESALADNADDDARLALNAHVSGLDALAAERRATVERIRERLDAAMPLHGEMDPVEVLAILDEEAGVARVACRCGGYRPGCGHGAAS